MKLDDLGGMLVHLNGLAIAKREAEEAYATAQYETVKYLADAREYGFLKLNMTQIGIAVRAIRHR